MPQGRACTSQKRRCSYIIVLMGIGGRASVVGTADLCPLGSLQRRAPPPRTPCSRPTPECSSMQVVSIHASPRLLPQLRYLSTPVTPVPPQTWGQHCMGWGERVERGRAVLPEILQAAFLSAGHLECSCSGDGQNFRRVARPGGSFALAGQLLIFEARFPFPKEFPGPVCPGAPGLTIAPQVRLDLGVPTTGHSHWPGKHRCLI